jgi:prophage regulatory protein
MQREGEKMKALDHDGLKAKGIPQGRVQIWRMVKAGRFPAPIKIGYRNAWLEHEIDSYLANLGAERELQTGGRVKP